MPQQQVPPPVSASVANAISKNLMTSVLAAITVIGGGISVSSAQSMPLAQMDVAPSSQVAVPTESNRFNDGVYLYGQAPEANQIGSAYFVFETRGDRFIGAFYMPQSSFDCVHGAIAANQLEMTIISSYGEGSYPYTVAMTDSAAIAGVNPNETELGLEGFHAISNLGDVDSTVLATCVSNYQEQVW